MAAADGADPRRPDFSCSPWTEVRTFLPYASRGSVFAAGAHPIPINIAYKIAVISL